MSIFDRLQKTESGKFATAIVATPATDAAQKAVKIAEIATIAVANTDNSFFKESAGQTAPLSEIDLDALYEHFTERAAIAEYDGGLDRETAERQALVAVIERVFAGGTRTEAPPWVN